MWAKSRFAFSGLAAAMEQEENRHELFMEKFAENQQRIRAFILSLAPGWIEADDIFQRVSMVLWTKWGSYDHSREFLSWALGVSRLEVLKYMSDQKRRNEVLSDEAIRQVEASSMKTVKTFGIE